MNGLRFSADPDDLDVARVHRWLSEESYWARGRDRATQDAIIAGSRNFGVYDDDSGQQLGYARVITDGVTFGWLADVFVDPGSRGRGVGVALVRGVTEAIEPLGLKRFALFTADAHGCTSGSGSARSPTPRAG